MIATCSGYNLMRMQIKSWLEVLCKIPKIRMCPQTNSDGHKCYYYLHISFSFAIPDICNENIDSDPFSPKHVLSYLLDSFLSCIEWSSHDGYGKRLHVLFCLLLSFWICNHDVLIC
jgi:hypothetical protein